MEYIVLGLSFEWIFLDRPKGIEQEVFREKYTGDNLKKFPIRLGLEYDNKTKVTTDELEELYTDVINQLIRFDIVCTELEVRCKDISGDKTCSYIITKNADGIIIEKE